MTGQQPQPKQLQPKLLQWLGMFPTTQGRVLATLTAVLGTIATYDAVVLFVTWRYLEICAVLAEKGVQCGPPVYWVPDYSVLTFLAVMSGIDWGAFATKRTTDASYVAAKMGTTPADDDPAPPTPEVAPR